MGYVTVLGPCLCCRRVFSYNPNHVPSLHYPPPDGPREPVCESCMHEANRGRHALGLAPFEIHPQAYEPEPEELLP